MQRGICVSWNPEFNFAVIELDNGKKAFAFPYSICGAEKLYEGEEVEIFTEDGQERVCPTSLRAVNEHLQAARDLFSRGAKLKEVEKLVNRAQILSEGIHSERTEEVQREIQSLREVLEIYQLLLGVTEKRINQGGVCPDDRWRHRDAPKIAQDLLKAREQLKAQCQDPALLERWKSLQRAFRNLYEESLKDHP